MLLLRSILTARVFNFVAGMIRIFEYFVFTLYAPMMVESHGWSNNDEDLSYV